MCAKVGSPLYEHLLHRSAQDVERDGPIWSLLEDHDADPIESMIGLRLLGASHRLALEGSAAGLAAHYPSTGGDGDPEAAWRELAAVAEGGGERLRELIRRPVQTNEVGRSAALLGGFLLIAARTGLPLRLLELGSSGGLNLRFDRYRYEGSAGSWGDADSPVRVTDTFEGQRPPLDASVAIAERAGCDPRPVDPATEEGRLTLLSYVWPDQPERLRQLEGALEIVRRVPVEIEQAPAADWLERRLSEPWPGTATVVFHSIVMQYLEDEERERVSRTLAAAGSRASAAEPLAHLAMEPGGEHADVRLTAWPEGPECLIATSGYHGRPVRWCRQLDA